MSEIPPLGADSRYAKPGTAAAASRRVFLSGVGATVFAGCAARTRFTAAPADERSRTRSIILATNRLGTEDVGVGRDRSLELGFAEIVVAIPPNRPRGASPFGNGEHGFAVQKAEGIATSASLQQVLAQSG